MIGGLQEHSRPLIALLTMATYGAIHLAASPSAESKPRTQGIGLGQERKTFSKLELARFQEMGLTKLDLQRTKKLDFDASLTLLGPEEAIKLYKLGGKSFVRSNSLSGIDLDELLKKMDGAETLSFLKDIQSRTSSPEERRKQIINLPDGNRSVVALPQGGPALTPHYVRGEDSAYGRVAWEKIDEFRRMYVLDKNSVSVPLVTPLVGPRRDVEKITETYRAANGAKRQVRREFLLTPLGRSLTEFAVLD